MVLLTQYLFGVYLYIYIMIHLTIPNITLLLLHFYRSYSVVDHFELSRETVAISIDLFDRYLATRGNRCNGSSALLTSLTTLYIAIKLNEPKKIKLTTLSNLSRGQFFPPDIEEMEFRILSSLDWMIHPPTVVSFVSHFLLFLPQVHSSVRKDIFELSRYCLLYTSPSPRDVEESRMPSSA